MRRLWEGWTGSWGSNKILIIVMLVLFGASLLLWLYLIVFAMIHLFKL